MPLLTVQEVRDFGLYADSPDSLILSEISLAQNYIETYGSLRPLEITLFELLTPVRRTSQTFVLPYRPVLSTTTVPAAPTDLEVSVRYRPGRQGLTYSGFGTEFFDLEPTDFTLEVDDSISLNIVSNNYFYQRFDYSRGRYARSRFDQARIRYYSGFDFSLATDPDVVLIKSAALKIMQYIASPLFAGTKREKVDDFYEVEFFGSATSSANSSALSVGPAAVPPNLLLLFAKYRPITRLV